MPKRFTREFEAEAVRLVLDEQMSQAEVAKDLGVFDTSIGRWVAQARVDGGRGPEGVLTSDEKTELRELRREVERLWMEREIPTIRETPAMKIS